jgi:type VI secretion system secreted protein Hcp
MSIFLKFGSVLGDVEDAGHVNWIDVKAVNWNVARPVTNPAGSSAGRMLSAAQVSELTIVKDQDIASIPLIQAAFEGSPVAAQIDFCLTGSGQQTVYYTITMTSTLITGFGQAATGARPSESVTFNFTQISFSGTQMGPDGKAASPASYGWNVSTNAPA